LTAALRHSLPQPPAPPCANHSPDALTLLVAILPVSTRDLQHRRTGSASRQRLSWACLQMGILMLCRELTTLFCRHYLFVRSKLVACFPAAAVVSPRNRHSWRSLLSCRLYQPVICTRREGCKVGIGSTSRSDGQYFRRRVCVAGHTFHSQPPS